ncbi:MAG: deoxyribonuclease IV [Nitrososphaerales archaeon]
MTLVYPREFKTHPLGIHVSISGKLDMCVDRAIEAGCVGAFQIFTCSPRRWDAPELKAEEVGALAQKLRQNSFQVFAHMPYLPNLSSPDATFHAKSVAVLKREASRCREMEVRNLVLHFGSHMKTSIRDAHKRIVKAIQECLSDTPGSSVRLLLENSAGNDSPGARFEFIKAVLDEIGDKKRVGVCFDTCHAFAAGYDLRTLETTEKMVEDFDAKVGLENLFLIHLNDSKGGLGEGPDRHENIGSGKIGFPGMAAVLNLKALRHIPVVLETPVENEGDDKKSIAAVKKLIAEK